MISLEDAMILFNTHLEKDGFKERFNLETKTFEYDEKTYESTGIIIHHHNEEFSIELSYEGGWILYCLNSHYHLDFIESLEDLLEYAYYDIIVKVLTDKIIVLLAYDKKGFKYMDIIGEVPDEIPFSFSKEEYDAAKKFKAVSWSGKEISNEAICFIISDDDDIFEYKKNM